MAKTGSSISVPIIKTSAIIGLSEKAKTATANAIVEFLARVVKVRAIISSCLKFSILLLNWEIEKLTIKNVIRGINNLNSLLQLMTEKQLSNNPQVMKNSKNIGYYFSIKGIFCSF